MSPTEAHQKQQEALRIALMHQAPFNVADYRQSMRRWNEAAPPVVGELIDQLLEVDRCEIRTRGRRLC